MGLCPTLLSLMFVLLTSVLSYAGDVSATTIGRTSLTATAAHAASGDIAPGTRITMQNWDQYSQFMPDGMRELFQGKYFWKMPADVALDVGPTVIQSIAPKVSRGN